MTSPSHAADPVADVVSVAPSGARPQTPPVAPSADPFSIASVYKTAKNDLYGTKDVQDVITATYVWLADQFGHINLGLLPTLVFGWVFVAACECFSFTQALAFLPWVLRGVALAGVFCYWWYKERRDYQKARERAGTVFGFDAADLKWNVQTALFYFGFGGILGFLTFAGWPAVVLGLAALACPALVIALWWLRRKIAFQQAGLPYLYRLTNFKSQFQEANAVDAVNSIRRGPAEPGITNHLLVVGPLGAGKTDLATGIGTEFAFQLGIGRYVSLTKMLELGQTEAAPRGTPSPWDTETVDGRVLWHWRTAALLIVDDVDAGVDAGTILKPEDFVKKVNTIGWKGNTRTVWILGEKDGGAALTEAWRKALAEVLHLPSSDSIAVVHVTKTPAT